MTERLSEVAVVGAGTLGRRIAGAIAAAGHQVQIYDENVDALFSAQKEISETFHQEVQAFPTLGSDLKRCRLIVECVPEVAELKTRVLPHIEELADTQAIIGTNSSSMPSSRFAGQLKRPARFLNTHFYRPPELMAVELMSCGVTDDSVLSEASDLLKACEFRPFICRDESFGFIFNRVWAAIKRESLRVVAEGVAEPDDVDSLFKGVFRCPMGPFELMDQAGLDVMLDIEKQYLALDPSLPEDAKNLLENMVSRGALGCKSGKGFYPYESNS